MSEQLCSPRTTAVYLDNYVGRVVTVVGKVMQLLGDQAVVDADGNITVHLTRDSHLQRGNAAQIIGKVNPDLSIKALNTRDVGTGVDMSLCSFIAEITPRCKDIFLSAH